MPKFELEFVSDIEDTDEEDVLLAVEDSSEVTCRVYAIKLDDEVKAEVNTKEEADKVVNDIKAEITSDLEVNLEVQEELKNKKELENVIVASDVAMATVNEDVSKKVDEYERQKAEEAAQKALEEAKAIASRQSSVTSRGVESSRSSSEEIDAGEVNSSFSGMFIEPVSGTLTSPYGYRGSGFHTGLDIATSSGTPIGAAAAGTVVFAGWSGGYGNLVKIDHGNGYQTYYAHCSAIYVSVGQSVSAGETISAVGSTGNSTGPHLHFEIRIGGETVNPQSFVY
ncbi:MAG: peptidoglycan DD-metalloendopeptidase family protein [Clostridia bacterium]|nr:peptidoglycan DD-metalloendopeptidase family protein [Clostridia bacterium]